MTGTQKTGIKSSYELALERLNREQGQVRELSREQKEALAEVERKMQAKVAEAEILFEGERDAARAAGDAARMAEIEESRTRRLAALRRDGEKEKEMIRAG